MKIGSSGIKRYGIFDWTFSLYSFLGVMVMTIASNINQPRAKQKRIIIVILNLEGSLAIDSK